MPHLERGMLLSTIDPDVVVIVERGQDSTSANLPLEPRYKRDLLSN